MIKTYVSPTSKKAGDAVEQRTKIIVNEDWCKGCGICAEFCPKAVLQADRDGKPNAVDPSLCIRCMLCEVRCPDFAITVRTEGNDGEDS